MEVKQLENVKRWKQHKRKCRKMKNLYKGGKETDHLMKEIGWWDGK